MSGLGARLPAKRKGSLSEKAGCRACHHGDQEGESTGAGVLVARTGADSPSAV